MKKTKSDQGIMNHLKNSLRRAAAVLLCMAVIITTIAAGVPTVKAQAADGADVLESVTILDDAVKASGRYTADWQHWSQGASSYSAMQWGCFVVAYAKMLAEAGYTGFGNPDGLFEWGKGTQFRASDTALLKSFGTAVTAYAQSCGGTAVCVNATNPVTLSGAQDTASRRADCEKIMGLLNDGYYVVLRSYSPSKHLTYIARGASLEHGTPWISDSGWSKGSGKPGKFEPYSSYNMSSYYRYTKAYCFRVSPGPQGGGSAQPSNPSITLGGEVSYPTGNLSPGAMFGIYGTIYSANNLTNVTASIYNAAGAAVQTKSVNPNSTVYSLRGPINNAMEFNLLSSGSYRFLVTASDVTGYTQTVMDSSFSVGMIQEPVFASSDRAGGVLVTMAAAEGTIYYTLDGSDPTPQSAVYGGPIALNGSATIKAMAKSGDLCSAIHTQYIAVHKLAAPTFRKTMDDNAYRVAIEAEPGAAIYYTTDGSNPNAASMRYESPIQMKSSKTIRAVAMKYGAADSDVAEEVIRAETPGLPSVSLGGSDKIAVGDAVKIAWDRQELAHNYTVKLYQGGAVVDEQTVQGCAGAFTLPKAGEYQITVTAHNFMGSSKESYPPVTVTAMEPCTVTFADSDGSVISSLQVKYGYVPELPENPSKRGYDFKKWDNAAVYAAVKEDVTAKAVYDKKKYIVKFLDADGNVYAPQQEVLFGESVTLPKDPATDQVGYAFMGWRCVSSDEESALDYNHVDANLTLQAVFDWGNRDLPVVASIAKAQQVDSNSYQVSVRLTNWPTSKTYCRLLVSLKTAGGKMVKTITRDVTLNAGQTTVVEDIELISDKVATTVEVNVMGLDGQKTAGAYAKAVTGKTNSYANSVWSDWSTQKPQEGVVSESKTMYRYREKTYTDTYSPSLAGWNWKGQTTTVTDWGPVMATTAYPGQSNTVQIVNTQTSYHYYHYCSNYYGGQGNVDSIACGSGNHYYHTLTTFAPLPVLRMEDQGGRQAYGGRGRCDGCSKNYYAWFLGSTTTTYYYQTRSISTLYRFWRWGDWSSYSDSRVSENTEREVQETTFYRYQIPMETPADKEDTSGKTYTQEGKLSGTALDLDGKRATILVYRSTNADPTENQLEYVGQTVIGKDNAYSFQFIPKEEPEEAKSNYIVALAIEGQTNLYNIDVIYAEKMRYKVTFYGRDGAVISECEVESGENAVVPEAPAENGYLFIGWDKDVTNIQSDKAVTARYKENEYTVVYVDFVNDTIEMLQLTHGSALPSPAVKETEGRKFLGWDLILDGTKTAEKNMILTARYEKKQYTVTFVDGEEKVVSKQIVDYGEAAVLPPAVADQNLAFLGWSTEYSWWNVTGDMTVKPLFGYEKTADTPLYQLNDIKGGSILTILPTEGQQAYYAVESDAGEDVGDDPQEDQAESMQTEENGKADGGEESASDPEDTEEEEKKELDWKLYTDEIFLGNDATVYFYATGEQMNNGNIVEVSYRSQDRENPYAQTAELCAADAQAQRGASVSVPVTLKTNPGMRGMGMIFRYDPMVFEEAKFAADGILAQGSLHIDAQKESGTVSVIWSSAQAQQAVGNLGTLQLKVKEQAQGGSYPITMTCVREATYDQNWMDVKLSLQGGTVTVAAADGGDNAGTKDPSEDNPSAPDINDPTGNPPKTPGSDITENPGTSGGQKPTQKPVKKPSVSKVKSVGIKAGKKKLAISWKKLSGAAGYQLQISTKKNFKGAKTISVSRSKKSYTKTGLKAKKKYYVRIRAYKTYKDAKGKTQKVYGKWTSGNKKTK